VTDPPAGLRGLVHQLGPVLIAATMFGVSDVSGKYVLESGSDVLTLLAFRSVVGLGLVFIWMRLGPPGAELPPRLKWISLGLGLLLTLNLFGVFKAVELVPVSIAILTYFIYPLLTGLFGALTGIDRLSWRGAVTAVIAFLDADPQGSLSLWHGLRQTGEPPLRTAVRGVDNLVSAAGKAGFEWVFIDTPPQMSGIVNDAIRAATLVVIPARPSVFDLDAVGETIAYARARRKPYAVVLNGAPAKRDGAESQLCAAARASLESLRAPVWGGQITHRTTYSLALAGGEGAREFDARSEAASEIARLFVAIERSVKAIQGEYKGADVMHRKAA
jgi:chromosome partitioning protein